MKSDKSNRNPVHSGDLVFGSGYISIQTMLKVPFARVSKDRLVLLKELGCSLLRLSVVDGGTSGLETFIKTCPMPVCVDVQGDVRLVFEAIKCGAQKVRINPAVFNQSQLKRFAVLARESGTCVRVGLNAGSCRGKSPVKLCQEGIASLRQNGLENLVASIKSSSVADTISFNEEFHRLMPDVPLHIGLTEAGPAEISAVRTAFALKKLFEKGIGSTLRVSISGSEESEVLAAGEILRLMGLRSDIPEWIACPMCARASVNTRELMNEALPLLPLFRALTGKQAPKIAIMGCPVNGIGEAKSADIGVSGVALSRQSSKPERLIVFAKGEKIAEAKRSEIIPTLKSICSKHC